jgi:hypothetical protein
MSRRGEDVSSGGRSSSRNLDESTSDDTTSDYNQQEPPQQKQQLGLVVFDLDYTVWVPEMYQLYGHPKLVPTPKHLTEEERTETLTTRDGQILTDKGGSYVRVFSGA